MLTIPNAGTQSGISNDFYTGFQQASQDYERRYKRQTFPIDEEQLSLIFVRVACDLDHTDLWKIGYLAGLFAALYGVLCGWSVSSYTWALGDCARIAAYQVDSVRRIS